MKNKTTVKFQRFDTRPKYFVTETVSYQTRIKKSTAWTYDTQGKTVAFLQRDGKITFSPGYSWDGASGPGIDSANFMDGSLAHDGLYQMLRDRCLPQNLRKKADQTMRDINRKHGMGAWRAWWTYKGVRWGGARSAKPKKE